MHERPCARRARQGEREEDNRQHRKNVFDRHAYTIPASSLRCRQAGAPVSNSGVPG
jgi:hypothetical protein